MSDDQKFSCQGCGRTDLTLTRNGKVRSHAADGRRVGDTNPACGMGSEYPKESTPFHTHRFAYRDDNHGHFGSFCECGMEEPDDPIVDQGLSQDPAQHVPPNPFRAPLPGGLWDNLPHDRQPEPPAPVVPRSADDFLDGSDDDYAEAADNGPSYWPARYDGECGTCFSHFDAGDMIRRVDGAYEAQNCCGDGAVPCPEVPRSVARTLPVVRGRYKLPDPETGKPVSASRSSKFAEGIADSYALDQWRHRMILVGVLNDPEIMEKVASGIRDLDPLVAVKKRREFLNARAEDAMSAAGGDIRSGKGTTLHSYTEEVDAGTRDLSDVPEEYLPDVTAYVHALQQCGFEPVKGLIERSVFCREMGVCGTFDRVLRCIRTTNVLDLDGRETTIHEGEFCIGDVKSGDNIEHPWLEILIQEALYAHAVNENGVAVQDEPGGSFRWAPLASFGVDKVREDVGVVMHVPYGSGECRFYAADLITGWRGAKICKDNRDFWKIKLPKVPIATYAVEPDTDGASGLGTATDSYEETGYSEQEVREELGFTPPTAATVKMPPVGTSKDQWTEEFREVRTKEEANALWRKAKDAGVDAMDLRIMVSLVQLDPKPQTAVSGPGPDLSDEPVAETGGSRSGPAQQQGQPNLTERAHLVTTKAEASALWKEMNEKIAELPEDKRAAARDYRDKLAKIMQERLKSI